MPRSSETGAGGGAGASAEAGAGDFESDLVRLETLVRELEAGGLPLEATFARYEEGVRLAKACRTRLDRVERRIEELLEDGTVRRLDVG